VTAAAAFGLALRLARRELRGGLRGFGVFLACLFLGVFAVSAVGSVSRAARAGLVADARALLGGDAELTLAQRELDPEPLAFLRARGEVSSTAELRAMAAALQGDPPARVLVELKGVDRAYPLYGRVALEPDLDLAAALGEEDGLFGAAADELVFQRLGAAPGDRVRVGSREYALRAVLKAEPDRAFRGFTLGPRLLVARESLAGTGLLEPGSLVTHAYRVRLAAPARAGAGAGPGEPDAASLLAELEARFPDRGWRTRTFDRAAPRIRYFLDRMTASLTLVGLSALLVGGLGVAGAVRGYLGEKRLHLAAMKCVGASGGLLLAAYLLQILLLGALGSAAGVAAGAALPYALASLGDGLLPVPLRPGIYPAPLLTGAAFGLLVALAFSLAHLDAARRISPAVLFRGYAAAAGSALRPGRPARAAVAGAAVLLVALAAAASGDPRLALWFSAGAALLFVLFGLLAQAVVRLARAAPRPANPRVRLGLANIHRPGSPSRSAIFSLGLGLTALVATALVQADLSALVERDLPAQAPSYFFVDILGHQAEAFDEAVAAVPGVTRVERLPTLRGWITHIAGVPVEQANIAPEVSWAVRGDRFLTYSRRPPEGSRIAAGAWWPEDYAGPPLLSLTSDLAAGFGVGVGDTLTVNVLGREITARIANLRDVEWATLALNFALVFGPGVLEGAPQSHLAAAYAEPGAEEALFQAVTGRFPNVSAVRVKEVLENTSRVIGRIGGVFRAVGGVAVLTGLLVLAGALSADQHRRLKDAILFKVCGATRRDILTAFGTEFLLLGLAAGAVAALAGTGAAWAVAEGILKTPFSVRPLPVVLTVASGVALTLLLGLLGTARVLRRKPAPYLREG
jgi:putative ABC transport system permease protein